VPAIGSHGIRTGAREDRAVGSPAGRRVAHLTTVDLSLRYLLLAQIEASLRAGDVVIGMSAPGPDVPYLESRGVRFVPLVGSTRSMALRSDLKAARSLWAALRRERVDVLHTHNPKPGIYGRIIGRLAGVERVVHTTHGLYATSADPWSRRLPVYVLEALASRFSHVELVQNPEDLELMHRWRLAPRRKLRLLGNGVDLGRFLPPTAAERSAVRDELGFASTDVVVGVVARLVAEKGIPELVDAVERLGPPFRLLLIGPEDVEKADALPGAVLERARRGRAVVTGHREDVERLYHAMDLFCLPSHREGFPRAAMEAAASGLPVVATDVRGCRQVVRPGETGLLVPVRDPDALADAIERCTDEREAFGAAGRRLAEEQFDEAAVVARVLEAYDR
jgi:glycosyltransferase involved in cell wall biosynthesis